MRAWAAKVAGRGLESFCEQCGAAGMVRNERRVADRPRGGELLVCRGCSLMTCRACWPGPFVTCRACCVRQHPVLVTLVGDAPAREVAATPAERSTVPARWTRRGRIPVLAAVAVLVVAVLAGSIALTRPGSGAGGVAGLTARSTPSETAAPAATDAAPTASAGPSSTADPGARPTASSRPTARPGTPADLTVTASAVRPWVDPLGELRAQVLVGVTNNGGSPAYLASSATAWEVRSPGGSVVAHGRFAHAFPRLVEPGATAWLVDALSATFAQPGELDELEVTLQDAVPTSAELAEQGRFTVRGVQWRVDAAGSLSVSGVVENLGSNPVGRWAAGVVLIAADGAPLAAAYAISRDELAPDETAWFTTAYPGSAPVDEEEVATVVAVAVPLD